ncbi:programmed cell death 1 ligand 2-like isoform X2 [Mustelus asterias]
MATYHFPRILCFIVISFFVTIIAGDAFINVWCKNPVTGIHNKRTVLACEYKSMKKKECNCSWTHMTMNPTGIPCTSNKKANAPERRRCLTDSGNVTLIIEKTEILDEGKYQLLVDCESSGYKTADTELLVKARYTVPQVTKSDRGGEKGLSCTTVGYPLAELHWQIENGTKLTANSSIIQMEDKLYNITTYISVIDEGYCINYSCSVCIENACTSARLDNPKTEGNYQQQEPKIRKSTGVYFSLGFVIVIFALLAMMVPLYWRNQISQENAE